jgi:hypothetical protein
MRAWRRRLSHAIVFVGCLVSGCGTTRPPFTQLASASSGANPEVATVIFLWPTTSCDPGGYYTVAAADGKFIGNLSTGTQLRTQLAAGQYTFFGWDEPREEGQAAIVRGTIPVLSANLAAGRTYYVRLAFGEWDETGPRNAFTVRRAVRVCIAPDHHMTSAFVMLTPTSELADELQAWTNELEALVPDVAAGQAWLDTKREAFTSHLSVAQARFDGLRPKAKRMATLQAGDGVPSTPQAATTAGATN